MTRQRAVRLWLWLQGLHWHTWFLLEHQVRDCGGRELVYECGSCGRVKRRVRDARDDW